MRKFAYLFAMPGRAFLLAGLSVFLPALLLAQNSQQPQTELILAVLKFSNNTEVFAFDALQTSVPEMLKTELSRFPSLVVVERERIEKILDEYALAQAGVLDQNSAQQVGQLLGARYILTGEISQIAMQLRIDCHILSVETGQVKGEKVVGPGRDAVEKMVQLLANNIYFNLAGEGEFTTKTHLRSYPTIWLATATVLTGIASGASHFVSQRAYDSYEQASRLDDFDRYYDRANNFRKIRNGSLIATGVLAIATITLWLQERGEGNQIYTDTFSQPPREPHFAVQFDRGISITWTTHF